ncbi:MAG: hypothetical protein WCL51_03700 [Bacteroidota bacterium]
MRNLNKGIVISNTTAITGSFSAIMVLTAATFTTLTSQDHTTNGAVTQSVAADYGTVPVGVMIYGSFTAITLSAGKVIAYI